MPGNHFEWNDAINKIFQMSREEREEYVAKITNDTTPADEIFEFVDEDVRSIENYVARELYKIFMQENPEGFFRVRKQILKKQKVDYFECYSEERLLLFNRFTLERSERGTLWMFRAEDEKMKERVRRAFSEFVEELKDEENTEILTLECRKDFGNCLVRRGKEFWHLDREDFMKGVEKI